jgi:hypothetical protein
MCVDVCGFLKKNSNRPKGNANMMQTLCKHLASIMLCFQSILGALCHLNS